MEATNQRRLTAAMELATAYTWTTSDGREARVERVPPAVGGGWYAAIDDAVSMPPGGGLQTALELAARLAPPADADLADLLTWTACGQPRT